MTRLVAAVIAAAALGGCASLYTVDADVSSFSRWPAGRSAATYAFERLPSQQAQPQQAQMLEDAARPAIEGAGFAAAPEGSAPDVTVQLGARITETDRSPYDDPFWYGGFGGWHRPFVAGRAGRTFWGPGWRHRFWDPSLDFPAYDREVAVLIRDKRSGAPLYEARAESQGPTAGVATVLPALYVAAMKDFPAGSTANPHRVTIETAH
ncbi:MAG TPA: DUF4136 domain-containing protein [Caldimonas sp.]|nr:DUF4136 domain-containing protein [Caldimonas sp.]